MLPLFKILVPVLFLRKLNLELVGHIRQQSFDTLQEITKLWRIF